MKVLVINAGSSSLKYQLLDPETGHLLLQLFFLPLKQFQPFANCCIALLAQVHIFFNIFQLHPRPFQALNDNQPVNILVLKNPGA